MVRLVHLKVNRCILAGRGGAGRGAFVTSSCKLQIKSTSLYRKRTKQSS